MMNFGQGKEDKWQEEKWISHTPWFSSSLYTPPFPLHPTGTLVCGDKDSLLLILSRKGRKCEVKTLLFHKQQSSDPGLEEDPVYHCAEQSGAEKETQTERKRERRVPRTGELDRHRERDKKKLKGRVRGRIGGERLCLLSSPLYLGREPWRITALIPLWTYWSPSDWVRYFAIFTHLIHGN